MNWEHQCNYTVVLLAVGLETSLATSLGFGEKVAVKSLNITASFAFNFD